MILNTIVYAFLFLLIFLETLIVLTFFENRKEILGKKEKKVLSYYPMMSLIVPSWNEEYTVEKTIQSILECNYPKDRLEIIAVDDGSTDATWAVMQKFAENPQIKTFKKENGGKHTALNLGIEKASGELIGCVDADTYLDKDALYYMAEAFVKDPELMAAPATIILKKSETFLEKIQKADFYLMAMWWKTFSYFDAVYIIPGQFSIFRKEVFQKIGGYTKGHLVEDMEITMRMRSNHLKIRSVHLAKAYTSGKPDLKALYKQRLRWTYGGIKTMLDYKHMMFNREYGVLGTILLPFHFICFYTPIIIASMVFVYIAKLLYSGFLYVSTVGFQFAWPKLDLFYLNPSFKTLVGIVLIVIILMIVGQGMMLSENRFKMNRSILYYVLFFWLLSPLWLLSAVIRVPFSKESSWR